MGVSAVNDAQNRWDALLSSAARTDERDERATDGVLRALRFEREGVTDGSAWAAYLSSVAKPSLEDERAVAPVLSALRAERTRVRQWRVGVTRWIAGVAAAAALIVGVTVSSLPRPADSSDAYRAYQEAAQGW
jgi:hypothetical protein